MGRSQSHQKSYSKKWLHRSLYPECTTLVFNFDRYEDQGLLDRTHLRWFTRQTIIELFNDTGFNVVEGHPRVFNETSRDKFLPIIGEIAKASGNDPDMAIADAMPLQYVVRAEPR